MKKRLFLGFPVELSASLNHAFKRVRINADKKGMEFFWTPKENLHVTLNFLGEIDVELVSTIETIIDSATGELAPVETSLRGMGAFPDEHHMRVLWVGVRKSRTLGGLQRELAEKLRAAGFPQEEREYLPHLTLGRLRKARTAVDLISPFVRTSFDDLEIATIVLYESLLAGSHPVYKKLRTFELRGLQDEP
jgi:RNA 2',3'-cyclic 3'-phosphodiesterase